jgi:hypothetical protein
LLLLGYRKYFYFNAFFLNILLVLNMGYFFLFSKLISCITYITVFLEILLWKKYFIDENIILCLFDFSSVPLYRVQLIAVITICPPFFLLHAVYIILSFFGLFCYKFLYNLFYHHYYYFWIRDWFFFFLMHGGMVVQFIILIFKWTSLSKHAWWW